MTGLDTNILVRLFAADDARQRPAAIDLIAGLEGEEKAIVNRVVVVELLWTLSRVYGFDDHALAKAARQLTEHPKLLVPERDLLRDAAHRSREEGGGIPDHLIALLNRQAGARVTYTFDERAAKTADFALLAA